MGRYDRRQIYRECHNYQTYEIKIGKSLSLGQKQTLNIPKDAQKSEKSNCLIGFYVCDLCTVMLP